MILIRLARVSGFLASTLIIFPAFAQDVPSASGHADHPHGPPPEAISACVSKTIGASCSFTGRQGETITGTCEAHRPHGPDGSQESASMRSTAEVMACHPPHSAMGGHTSDDQKGPPPPK